MSASHILTLAVEAVNNALNSSLILGKDLRGLLRKNL